MGDAPFNEEPRLALWCHGHPDEAAAEIERLREALEPFAKIGNYCHPRHRDSRPFIFGFDTTFVQRLTVGDLRRASLALTGEKKDAENG